MPKNGHWTVFEAGKFLDWAADHLLVRAYIQRMPAQSNLPEGQLRINLQLCAYHEKAGDTGILNLKWEHYEPEKDPYSLIRVKVFPLWGADHSASFAKAEELLHEWSQVPDWDLMTPEVATVHASGTTRKMDMNEDHILQYFRCFHTALVAHQGHMLDSLVRESARLLGFWIATKNRSNERHRGSFIQTPNY